MTTPSHQPSLKEVLDAFAVEPHPGREVLERYMRQFPEYAADLVDLSREVARAIPLKDSPLSEAEEALIESAWRRLQEAATRLDGDPLETLSVAEQRRVAQQLDVPRQIITAFREHRVDVASVPHRFLQRLAEAVNAQVDALNAALSAPVGLSLARSYKADEKPGSAELVTFEQLLIDAGVPAERRTALLTEGE